MPIKVKGTEIVDDNRNIKNADGSQITGIVTTAIQGTGGIIVSPSKGNVVVSYPSTSYWVEDSVGINTTDKVGIGTDSDQKLSAYKRTSVSNFDPFYDYSLVLKESLSFESGVKIGVGAGENTSVSSGTSSIYIGYNAGRDSVGSDNYFVGYCAGSNTTGSFNISIGSSSGRSSSGSDNIFVGESAGEYNKSDNNIFYGNNAGQYNCANSSYNIAIGQSSGKFNDGNCNIFFGNSSGECNSGNANISFGDLSGQCKSGSENVSLGSSSGQFNVGSRNISLGTGSGQCTTGSDNISLGTNSGKCTAGDSNISLGTRAGERNTGDRGIFLGCCSGFSNTTDDPIFIGTNAGSLNLSGNKNIFVGNQSGYCNSTGSFNIFLGKYSGYNHTCNNENIFIGRYAGYSNGDANQNIFVGECSGFNNVSGEKNIFFGECSGLNNLSGEKNIFFGPSSGRDNASGNRNINIGTYSGRGVTDKDENIFIGLCAGYGSRGLSREIIIGHGAGCGYYSGSKNIFIGRYAGSGYVFSDLSCGSHKRYVHNNIFVGNLAGSNSNTGDQGNTCNNIVIGSSGCLKDVCDSITLTSFNCPSLYSKSLLMNYFDSSTGPDNIEIGMCTLNDNNTGHNIFLGMHQRITLSASEWRLCRNFITGCPSYEYRLCPISIANRVGNTCYHIGLGHHSYSGEDNCNNIMIGAFSASTYNSISNVSYSSNVRGLAFSDSSYGYDGGSMEQVTFTTNSFVGNYSSQTTYTCYDYTGFSPDGITDVDDCGQNKFCRTHKGLNNRIGIGNTLHTHFYTKMAANSGGSEVLWSSSTNELFAQSSSRRFKTNIRPFLGGIKETLQLNPVRYKAIEDPNGRDHIGFIAEELDQTDVKEFVIYDENQEPLSVSYDKMVALLTNTIKELNKENEDMMNQIEELETMVNNHI